MDAFQVHFRVLIAGGLATALLSLPIDTRLVRPSASVTPPGDRHFTKLYAFDKRGSPDA